MGVQYLAQGHFDITRRPAPSPELQYFVVDNIRQLQAAGQFKDNAGHFTHRASDYNKDTEALLSKVIGIFFVKK